MLINHFFNQQGWANLSIMQVHLSGYGSYSFFFVVIVLKSLQGKLSVVTVLSSLIKNTRHPKLNVLMDNNHMTKNGGWLVHFLDRFCSFSCSVSLGMQIQYILILSHAFELRMPARWAVCSCFHISELNTFGISILSSDIKCSCQNIKL